MQEKVCRRMTQVMGPFLVEVVDHLANNDTSRERRRNYKYFVPQKNMKNVKYVNDGKRFVVVGVFAGELFFFSTISPPADWMT